jgi:hypothetical protein
MERAVDDQRRPDGWRAGRQAPHRSGPWRRGPAHPAEPSREQATQGQSTMIACRAERLLTFPESVALTAAIGASKRCRTPPIAPMTTRQCSGAQGDAPRWKETLPLPREVELAPAQDETRNNGCGGASALRRAGRASDAIASGDDVAAIGALPAPAARPPGVSRGRRSAWRVQAHAAPNGREATARAPRA